MTEVRTRFAPSPTGYLHIGGLRTALYAWLFAKKNGGKFILRIEDTDRQRYVEDATDIIFRTLAEAGITHDEGPDIGGPYGPYVQSERRAIYKEYADKLVELGGAYYCFCTRDEIESRRAAAEGAGGTYRYERTCADIPLDEARARISAGEPYVVRQRIPKSGTSSFDDLVFGRISVDVTELEDGVLLKSDGLPTYNFANVIDDNLMKINYVIRGTEYLSSTPRYNLIYNSFGWEIPKYIHLSPVMRDAQHKLSKRDGDASYEDFIKKGYLKDALINYVALLGWSPKGTEEIFDLSGLIEAFDLAGLSKSPAIFDTDKLTWMNGEYIRAMRPDAFDAAAAPYYDKVIGNKYDKDILRRILQPRLETFAQISEKLRFLCEMPEYDTQLYVHKKMKTDEKLALDILRWSLPKLSEIEKWTETSVHDSLMSVVAEHGLKNGQVFWSVRIAVTGMAVTPGGAVEAAALLGKGETIRRMSQSIKKLETL